MGQLINSGVKRIFDICASGIALVVLLPLWIVAIVGIEISDPGPIFYMANRVGKHNKNFRMFKFRSMRVDKNADEKNFKADTNRIFKWGEILRATKIDELPQLINVFIGQMSVIGPRPASADQVAVTRAGKYAVISKLQPGLSGPSALYDYIYGDQIEDEEEYKEKVLPTRLDLDLYYIKAKGIFYDLKMIWYTVICIFSLITKKFPQWMYDELVAAAATVAVDDIHLEHDNVSYRR